MRLGCAIGAIATVALAAPSGAAADVLYDQFDAPGSGYAASNQFVASSQQYSEVADDFSVPAGEVWTLSMYEVGGTGSRLGEYPLPGVNLRIYRDVGHMPGPLFVDRPNYPASHDPNFNGPFYGPGASGASVIAPGHYWFSVQLYQSSSSSWSWQTRQVQSGDPAVVRSSACPNWGIRASCDPLAPEPDQRFRLFGYVGKELVVGEPIVRPDGTARIPVSAAVTGTAVAQDNRVAAGAKVSIVPRPRIKRTGTYLPIPGANGRLRKRLRVIPTSRVQQKLEAGRKVRVKVRITFTPDGGISYSETKRVTLEKRR